MKSLGPMSVLLPIVTDQGTAPTARPPGSTPQPHYTQLQNTYSFNRKSTMAIKFETLKSYMPDIGLKNFDSQPGKSENDGDLIAGFSAETSDDEYKKLSVGVILSLQENGEFLQIRFARIIEKKIIQESLYRAELMRYFLQINYERKIGRWCLDPDDGDVYIDWAIAIEDNDKLTLNQVKRITNSLISSTRETWPSINRILKTGSELNTETLKKDILLMLMDAKQFDIMPMLGNTNNAEILAKIKILATQGNFIKIKEALNEI